MATQRKSVKGTLLEMVWLERHRLNACIWVRNSDSESKQVEPKIPFPGQTMAQPFPRTPQSAEDLSLRCTSLSCSTWGAMKSVKNRTGSLWGIRTKIISRRVKNVRVYQQAKIVFDLTELELGACQNWGFPIIFWPAILVDFALSESTMCGRDHHQRLSRPISALVL